MCVFGQAKPDAPRLPVEYAAQRAPDNQNIQQAGSNAKDRLRAAASTMLTGSNGTGAIDASGKKTLLGA